MGWMTQFISHWRAPDAARTFPALALQACRSALPRMKTKCRITASRIPENNRTQSKFKTQTIKFRFRMKAFRIN
ncbi:hypothetical protein [Burkholderia pseudomallei]|nr:hypothetical protein [Burkholderia pseudomallei]